MRISSSLLTAVNYVSTENMLQDFQGVTCAHNVPEDTNVMEYKQGDVLVSNIRPYLKKVWMADKDGGCSADVFVMRANSNVCTDDFLHHIVANDRFIGYVMSGAKGVKMPRGDKEQMKGFKTALPSLKEQQKVAHLLAIIDERISTQNRIINELQSLIIGLEQTLLKPQSNWTSCFIGDVLSIGSGRDYKHLSEGDIPVYGTGGYMLSVNDFLYDGESVCIGRKGTIDKPLYLHCKFWTVDTLFYTYDFRQILPRYCYYLFNTINWLKYNEASGVPSLSKDTIERIKISIPSIEEQKRVCDIIDSVDEKLSLEITFRGKLISLKQFLLSSLFV